MIVFPFLAPLIPGIGDLNNSGISGWLIIYVHALIIIDGDLILTQVSMIFLVVYYFLS